MTHFIDKSCGMSFFHIFPHISGQEPAAAKYYDRIIRSARNLVGMLFEADIFIISTGIPGYYGVRTCPPAD